MAGSAVPQWTPNGGEGARGRGLYRWGTEPNVFFNLEILLRCGVPEDRYGSFRRSSTSNAPVTRGTWAIFATSDKRRMKSRIFERPQVPVVADGVEDPPPVDEREVSSKFTPEKARGSHSERKTC